MADDNEFETEEEKKARLQKLVPGIPEFLLKIPGLGPVFSFGLSAYDSLTSKLSEAAFVAIAGNKQLSSLLGVSPAEISTKETLFATINNSSAFADVATKAGLDPSIATALKADCIKALKNSYGLLGLDKNPRQLAASLAKLHEELTDTIYSVVINKPAYSTPDENNNLDTETADKLAKAESADIATAILGVDIAYLQSRGLASRLGNPKLPPLKGLAGMLFQTQSALTAATQTGSSSVDVPALTINTEALKIALNPPVPAAVDTAKAAADETKTEQKTPVAGGATPTTPPTAPPPTPPGQAPSTPAVGQTL